MVDTSIKKSSVSNIRISSKINLENICVYITLICNFLILLFNPLRNSFVISWSTRVLILSVICLTILMFVNFIRLKRIHKNQALFVLLLLWTTICILFNGSLLDLDHIVSFLCFLMLPTYSVVYQSVSAIRHIKNVIYFANIAYSLVFISYFFSDYAYRYLGQYGYTNLDVVTLGYNNPNETGIYLMVSLLIMITAFFDEKSLLAKACTMALTFFEFYILLKTESRICIIISVLFIIITFTKITYLNGNHIQWLCILMPLVTLLITVAFTEAVSNIELFGETIETGRNTIYHRVIDQFDILTVLFGDFKQFAGANMHNSYISIIAMFGIPALIIYILFFKSMLGRYSSGLHSKSQCVAFWGVIGIIIHGVAEASMIISGTVFAGLAGLLFILMLPDNTEQSS